MGSERAVLRFSGKELLQVPGTVPPTGSLFVVFRPDPAGAPGQRLIGWEDASVGQHGLGMMTDAAGAVHAILRRNGANGDVVVPAPTPVPTKPEFQISASPGDQTELRSIGTGRPLAATRESIPSPPTRPSPLCGSADPALDRVPGFRETWRNCESSACRWMTRLGARRSGTDSALVVLRPTSQRTSTRRRSLRGTGFRTKPVSAGRGGAGQGVAGRISASGWPACATN